jgi:hypothetical protein
MSGYYGQDAAFARAQRAYDNAEPPDWDGEGVEYKECDAVIQRVVTNALGADEAYWTCPECGTEHADDAEAEEWEE